MKKVMKVALAAMMCIPLVGCGSSDSGGSKGKIELTFWGHQNEPWNASYQKIAENFEEENPDIHINFEFFPYDQFESKVQTSLMSKEGGADIYELWGGWGLDFASTGSLAQIDGDLEKNVREDAYPSTIGALEHDGKLYGVPMEFNIENGAMLVNNKLMDDLSLKTPTTWEKLRETGKKATQHDGQLVTIKGFDFVNWDSVPYMFLSMILSTGGNYQNEDETFHLQTEEAVNAMQELHDMVVVDGMTTMEGLTGGGDLEGYQQLYAGKTVMVPRGPWTISEGETSFNLKYGKDFDYISMPWYGEKPAFAAETGWSMAVNANSKKQEAAFKFLKYFFQDDVLMEHNIACSQIPPKKSVATDPELLKAMPYAEPLVKILDYSQFIGYFNTDQFKEKVNDVFMRYVDGNIKSAKEACEILETELNTILK